MPETEKQPLPPLMSPPDIAARIAKHVKAQRALRRPSAQCNPSANQQLKGERPVQQMLQAEAGSASL